MLHDIGKVLMAELFPNEYGQALELVRSGRYEHLFQAEQDLVGADHAELAGLLLTHWKFPAMISGPVAVHHREECPEPRPSDSALLRVSNYLAQELDMGGEGNRVLVGLLPRDGELLTLTAAILDETRRHLEERRAGIEDFYSAIT
jgi:HD-like signal output (HDOD) protein